MADLKFIPVRHDHKVFMEKASKRRGFDLPPVAVPTNWQEVRLQG